MIVIHLLGSHPNFCNRLWQNVEFSYINTELSCYLQSIKQTDELLENIVKMLKQYARSYSLLYFSDHGLSFTGQNTHRIILRVGNKTKQNYEIPLIVLSSDDIQQQRIQFRQSSINFLYGFAEWAGIQFTNPEQFPSFWQGTKQPIQVYDWTSWVDFDSLKSEPALFPPK